MDATPLDSLMILLKSRFEKYMLRHPDIDWHSVQMKLEGSPDKLKVLSEMERTGGEPDVIGYDINDGTYIFCDCSQESPTGRRSLCYDREARDSRKEHKPQSSAMEMADAIGIEMLTKEQYRELQKTGEYDRKTSSWVKTPTPIRELGGAIFCDRRYNHVFVYHNGADSYYAARGFRGLLKV